MICSRCKREIEDNAAFCRSCGQAVAQPGGAEGPAASGLGGQARTSVLAIVSLVLGILAWLSFGLTALFGLILGLVALSGINKSHGQLTGRGMAVAALWLSGSSLVLALLFVPAAILFPVFARAREAARMSSCQSNLKELASAVQMYETDYNAMLPSSVLAQNPASRSSRAWNPKAFAYFASRIGQWPPTNLPAGTPNSWPMLLHKYVKTRDSVLCPSDPQRSQTARARTSYYWKAAVDVAWFNGLRKEGDFAFPADQMLLYEHNGWHRGDASKGLTNGVTINCAFLDGHVGSKMIANSGYSLAENPPEALPQSGAGEPAWFNYSYGSASPTLNVGANWDPRVWGDNLQ